MISNQSVAARAGPAHLAIAASLATVPSRCYCGGSTTSSPLGGALSSLGARGRRCTACATITTGIVAVVELGADNFLALRTGLSGGAVGGGVGLGSLK